MIKGLEILDDMNRATGKIDEWMAEGETNGSRATLPLSGASVLVSRKPTCYKFWRLYLLPKYSNSWQSDCWK
jgi:hypothetical protein